MSDTQQSLAVTDSDRIAFHMAEFNALKAEIAELVKQSAVCMTFAITSCGAITAWLLTNPGWEKTASWAAWLPLAVSSLFGLLALSYFLRLRAKACYLGKIERRLGAADLGWQQQSAHDPWLIGAFHMLVWGALNAGGIFIGCTL